MKLEEVKVLLSKLWSRKHPVILLGPPGCGKTVSVYELAREIAKREGKIFVDTNKVDDSLFEEIMKNPEKYFVFSDIRLYEVDPVDFKGIPAKHEKYYRYLPGVQQYLHGICSGIIFMDEITMTQPELVAEAMKITCERRIGDIPLHPETMVILAGNPPEQNSAANELPLPLINKCLVLRVDPPSLDGWIDWMNQKYGSNWDKRVAGFLRQNPQYFLQLPDTAETLEPFPTPRSWTMLATTINPLMKSREVQALAEATVGKEAASRFAAFIKFNLDILHVIRNPQKFKELTTEQQVYACSVAWNEISRNPTKNNLEAFNRFLGAIPKELAVFTLRVGGFSNIAREFKRHKVDTRILGQLIRI